MTSRPREGRRSDPPLWRCPNPYLDDGFCVKISGFRTLEEEEEEDIVGTTVTAKETKGI